MIKNLNNINNLINFLHQIRPLILPSFSFFWIELISNKYLIYILSSRNYLYHLLILILSDFILFIVYLEKIQEPPFFQIFYKLFLKLILILSHDYPDFFSSSSENLIYLLPINFFTIRNIILSTYPKNISYISPKTIDLKIDLLFEIHQINFITISNSSILNIEILEIINNIFDQYDLNKFEKLRIYLNNYINNFLIISNFYEFTFHLNYFKNLKLPFQSLIIVKFLNYFLDNSNEIILSNIINCILDNIKFPCRNTYFFIKLILEFINKNNLIEIIFINLIKRIFYLPYPWGIQILLYELINNNKDIYKFPSKYLNIIQNLFI